MDRRGGAALVARGGGVAHHPLTDLMSRQGQLHDALESVIGDLEETLQGIKEKEAQQAA